MLIKFHLSPENCIVICYCHLKVRVDNGIVKQTETSPHAVKEKINISDLKSFQCPFPLHLIIITMYFIKDTVYLNQGGSLC